MNRPGKLFQILIGCLWCHILAAQTTYYISSRGSNTNSGTSPASPWQNLRQFEPGNIYLFRRNDTFYFSIPRLAPGTVSQTRIGAYGSGATPVISLYTHIAPESWHKGPHGLWWSRLGEQSHLSGFLKSNSNVGFLNVNGILYGDRKTHLNLLVKPWDFYIHSDTLYVAAPASPALFAVSFASEGIGINLGDNMEVRNLKVIGAGGHGIQGVNCKNISLQQVEIAEIGGSYLPNFGSGTVRYGNGLEFWNGGENILVEGCAVEQVYDAAFTLQGIGNTVHFKNIVFRKNRTDRNEQSFEFWISGGGRGFDSCAVLQNHCYNAGYGWSHQVRPEKNTAVHILTSSWEAAHTDLTISKNVFHRARSGLYYHKPDESLPRFESGNNRIVLDDSTPIRALRPEFDVGHSQAFVAASGKEKGSSFLYTNLNEKPPDLNFISAYYLDSGKVMIAWESAIGFYDNIFWIERAIGDTGQFRVITTIKGQEGLLRKQYRYLDHPPRARNIRYRLKQWDGDHHYTSSNLFLKRGRRNRNGLTVYPNPAQNNLYVLAKLQESGFAQINLLNSMGRLVYSEPVILYKGQNNININVSLLLNGIYFVQLLHDNITFEIERFIKM